MKYVGIKNLINSFEKEIFEKIKIRNESKLNRRQLFVSKSAIMILLENNEIPFFDNGWDIEINETMIAIREAGGDSNHNDTARIFQDKIGKLYVVCYFNDETYYDTYLLHAPGYSGDILTAGMIYNSHRSVSFSPSEKLFKQEGE